MLLSAHHFASVAGNPETATDPSGHWGFGAIFTAVTNVVKAAVSAIAHAVQTTAPIVASVANSVLDISSMVGDVQTIFNPNTSWSSKLLSVGDLGVWQRFVQWRGHVQIR